MKVIYKKNEDEKIITSEEEKGSEKNNEGLSDKFLYAYFVICAIIIVILTIFRKN